MRDLNPKTEYSSSHSLVIGTNEYLSVAPLQYATSDAEAMAVILKDLFSFPEENITILLDKQATCGNILSSYMKYGREGCDRDGRLLFFFAGHGYTRIRNDREFAHKIGVRLR